MNQEYFNIITRNPSAWIGHEEWAIRLVEKVVPSVIIDLGVDYGFSTFSFAYPKIGKVYGVDWFKGDANAGFRDTYPTVCETHDLLNASFGVGNVTFIKSDFKDSIEILKASFDSADIIHIDGDHSYDAVSQNFFDFSCFMREDSIVLFHDTMSFPETVGRFFNELDGFKINREGSHGLGIFTKSSQMFDLLLSI